jgi:glycosyltransferase involved in cell wall biosynthesis
MSFHCCILIPVYNHEDGLKAILPMIQAKPWPILLVDDGSDPSCHNAIKEFAALNEKTEAIFLEKNRGKGGALKAGFQAALDRGFTHALQIDADGQHDINDIEIFIKKSEQYPQAIICGYPIYDDSVPKHRYYARYLTHIWVWINSLSFVIKDSMCGFRCYPIQKTLAIIHNETIGNRMEFESEIMVHWVWRQGQVINQGTKVSYPIDGISHFLLWKDNALITKMHTQLFFGMLMRLPKLFLQKLNK